MTPGPTEEQGKMFEPIDYDDPPDDMKKYEESRDDKIEPLDEDDADR
jgi:hypothetical protein